MRRTLDAPAARGWLVRGSVATAAWCPGARPPVDLDYLVPGAGADFDAARLAAAVRAIAARPDPEAALTVVTAAPIWVDSPAPGLRAGLRGAVMGVAHDVQLDLAVGDPTCVPAVTLVVADVGSVPACAPETMLGWKLHGLCEFGRGRWRAKDLFDVDLLWRHAALDHAAARDAVALAFASRGLPLAALDDFRTRPTWGQSTSGRRKWRALARQHPAVDDFGATRARVRAAIDVLLEHRAV